ncbi:plasmid partitioning protein RepB [Rhizobium terrae]|uniref:plasmid partitioning protein RepB n=1 Tax=Rhizobium terrae TaxID=2171756 RepID=UPI000E3E2B0B|nr:plasmid partitioning protein RepB [Rhizobium terrae]
MSRKGIFAHLSETAENGQTPAPRALSKPKALATVTKSLGDLSSRGQRADELEKILAAGQSVIELETDVVDPSFVRDRMDSDISGLKARISEQGQQVPVLVRPHPDTPGRYQVAFGHRRLRAVSELGLKLKAVVRDLTDEQLVIAQGQENNEREDLTFIEKARFAHQLHKQFSRDVIISSMSLDKADLSKMLQIVETIPEAIVDAIGRAPGVGRRSWLDMAAFVEKASDIEVLTRYATSKDVQGLESAARFKAILLMKSKRTARSLPDVMSAPAGDRLAQIKESKAKLELVIDKRATPDFASFLLEQVPSLFEEYRSKQKLKTGD